MATMIALNIISKQLLNPTQFADLRQEPEC